MPGCGEIETTYFFRLLRQHTIEGMFCDPMHGGNADLIGWQLIGYPGPYMSWSEHIEQHHGKAFRPKPRSLNSGGASGKAVGGCRVKTLPRADVAIAGGGWAGLLLAKELGARTGLSVVVLERGGPRKTADYFEGMDELDYAIRFRMMQDARKRR